jgi:hypothetical protein
VYLELVFNHHDIQIIVLFRHGQLVVFKAQGTFDGLIANYFKIRHEFLENGMVTYQRLSW